MRKRYMLFAVRVYYPSGGKDDVAGVFDTMDEAIEAGRQSDADYFHVLDMETGEWTEDEWTPEYERRYGEQKRRVESMFGYVPKVPLLGVVYSGATVVPFAGGANPPEPDANKAG